MATETNGHKVAVVEMVKGEEKFYAECLSCDWTGEIHSGDAGEGAEAEASAEGEGHETDMAYDPPGEDEYDVKLTEEQIKILLSITGPRIETDPGNKYGDWSVDLDRRLREGLGEE